MAWLSYIVTAEPVLVIAPFLFLTYFPSKPDRKRLLLWDIFCSNLLLSQRGGERCVRYLCNGLGPLWYWHCTTLQDDWQRGYIFTQGKGMRIPGSGPVMRPLTFPGHLLERKKNKCITRVCFLECSAHLAMYFYSVTMETRCKYLGMIFLIVFVSV